MITMTTFRTLLFILLFPIFSTVCSAQSPGSWVKWNFLVGTWVGEGSGQPGQGSGSFLFAFDLDQKILIRKSHTEFPASGGRPATIHDDLMIVYPESGGDPSKAIYFDNEGHVIHYSIVYSGESVILTSEKMGNMPVFRLTYNALDSVTVNTKFEMSQDGVKFATYIEGKSKKSK
jgi:hypothetical protein